MENEQVTAVIVSSDHRRLFGAVTRQEIRCCFVGRFHDPVVVCNVLILV